MSFSHFETQDSRWVRCDETHKNLRDSKIKIGDSRLISRDSTFKWGDSWLLSLRHICLKGLDGDYSPIQLDRRFVVAQTSGFWAHSPRLMSHESRESSRFCRQFRRLETQCHSLLNWGKVETRDSKNLKSHEIYKKSSLLFCSKREICTRASYSLS